MIHIADFAHQILAQCKHPKIAIDMTAGNGYDTLFLSQIAQSVFAFDIQDLAIERTRQLLQVHQVQNVKVIKESHDLFDIYVNQEVDLVIYNLGYLPHSDKQTKTKANIVLQSLQKVLDFLRVGGIIAIVVYLHDREEDTRIGDYVSTLSSDFDVMKYSVLNKKDSPYIISIQRIKK